MQSDYLRDKLAALKASEASCSAYIEQLDKCLAELKETAMETEQAVEKNRERRVASIKQRGIKSLPFYKFDNNDGATSLGLQIMQEIGYEYRKRDRNSKLEQGELASNVSTSSSEDSEDDPTPDQTDYRYGDQLPAEDSENFEDFDSFSEEGAIGKRLQKLNIGNTCPPKKLFKNSNMKMRSSVKSEDSVQLSHDSQRPSHKHEKVQLDLMEPHEHEDRLQNHNQRLNEIILENEMTVQNIRNFNLVEIAAKKNSVKHLQQVGLPIFGLQIYKQFRIWNRLPPSEITRATVSWTPEEDRRLVQLVELFSARRWKQISYYMDGKKPSHCYHRWFRVLCQKRVTSKWDDPKDDVLLGLGSLMFRRSSGKYRWVKVAELFNGRRTDIQCRERFVNILDPSLKAELCGESEKLVKGLYDQFGKQWAKIAKEVKGTTDNLIKRAIEKETRPLTDCQSERKDEQGRDLSAFKVKSHR